MVDVVVSYAGFIDARQQVSVGSSGAANVEIPMKSSRTITMEKFTVESVREGQALSITEQRNALDVSECRRV